jgi:hypothetical protein
VVSVGSCLINASANLSGTPNLVVPGKKTGYQVRDVGVLRTTGLGAPVKTLTYGILIP